MGYQIIYNDKPTSEEYDKIRDLRCFMRTQEIRDNLTDKVVADYIEKNGPSKLVKLAGKI